MSQAHPSLLSLVSALRIVTRQREEALNEMLLQWHQAQCFQAALCGYGGELTTLFLSGRRGINTSEIAQENSAFSLLGDVLLSQSHSTVLESLTGFHPAHLHV